MDYSFNAAIAARYGVEEAVFVHNLYWWIMKNQANGRHYYDGHSWTYNTMEAMAKLFPFWTARQVRRIVKNLRDNGAILTGNYNQITRDRTTWYTLSDEVLEIYQTDSHLTERSNASDQSVRPNGQSHLTERSIPSDQTVKCYKEQIVNTDSKPDIYKAVVAFLNEKAGTNYRVTEKTRALIRARLNEKFTLEDFQTVIAKKSEEWNREPGPGDKDMRRYLRPETLFGTKFENYLNQPAVIQKPPTPPGGRKKSFAELAAEMEGRI